MNWVCPSCNLEFQPEGHDLDRCRWVHEVEMTIFQYALLRAAYQVATPSQRQTLADLARRAEEGDSYCLVELKQFMLELVRKARERAAAAGR